MNLFTKRIKNDNEGSTTKIDELASAFNLGVDKTIDNMDVSPKNTSIKMESTSMLSQAKEKRSVWQKHKFGIFSFVMLIFFIFATIYLLIQRYENNLELN